VSLRLSAIAPLREIFVGYPSLEVQIA
jgi:hypothetical protein